MRTNNEQIAQKIELRNKILFEYLPMAFTFIGIVVCAIVFKQRVINTLPVCFSLLIMLFNARANRIGFLLGAANSMIYLVGYFSERLYGTVGSTIVGAIIQVLSFFQWKRKSYKGNSTHFRVLTSGWRIFWLAVILLAWAITVFVLWKLNANQALLDGLTLVFGLILPISDMFAVIDGLPLKVLSQVIQLITWIMIVLKGNISNLTYVFIMLYNVYMVSRLSLRWISLYREQKALKEQGKIDNEN